MKLQPVLFGILLSLLTVPARAQSSLNQEFSRAASTCLPAIETAERSVGIPDYLLLAIGHAESDRTDPGYRNDHAVAVDYHVDGQSQYYESKSEAIAAVLAAQAHGAKSIDVGCMQISLLYHPAAFASLEDAFAPQINATYAAHFLKSLFAETNNWTDAVGRYHSATPKLAEVYKQKVLACLPATEVNQLGRSIVVAAKQTPLTSLAIAWASTLSTQEGRNQSEGMFEPVRTTSSLQVAGYRAAFSSNRCDAVRGTNFAGGPKLRGQ